MIHQALKLLRTSHNLTQVELAKEIGVSKSYFSEIESGHKKVDVPLLEKYSGYFDIPISSIFYLSESLDGKSPPLPSKKVQAMLNLHELTHHK